MIPLPPETGTETGPDASAFRGYQLLETLDAPGGASRTCKARDTRFDRLVALRFGTPHPAAAGAAEAFFGSAAGVARVRHERLARGLDVGRSGPHWFMAWEFARGESLAERLAGLGRGRIAEPEALRLAEGMALALQALYEAGLSHRALTPASIRCLPDTPPILTGIGWAHECFYPDPAAAALARADYAAPEQFEEAVLDDIRADLYALGCVWFRALFGRPPYPADTPAAAAARHRDDPVPDPLALDPRLSPATAKAIAWLLAKDRDERPRSPAELLKHLSANG